MGCKQWGGGEVKMQKCIGLFLSSMFSAGGCAGPRANIRGAHCMQGCSQLRWLHPPPLRYKGRRLNGGARAAATKTASLPASPQAHAEQPKEDWQGRMLAQRVQAQQHRPPPPCVREQGASIMRPRSMRRKAALTLPSPHPQPRIWATARSTVPLQTAEAWSVAPPRHHELLQVGNFYRKSLESGF